MKPPTPAFTKRLAAGLGLGEDPAGGTSFGLHRCDLLADGLVEAHQARQSGLRQRLAMVAARFATAGIALERPYLNSDSQDVYPFEPRDRPPLPPRHGQCRLRTLRPSSALPTTGRPGGTSATRAS